mmetsp:Transcript_2922/g.8026  ORF Transcript_2922/g.8026 Transcript_2922/m.8026 type:complete len:201 (+) Transcript_2922:1799-2401(+)
MRSNSASSALLSTRSGCSGIDDCCRVIPPFSSTEGAPKLAGAAGGAKFVMSGACAGPRRASPFAVCALLYSNIATMSGGASGMPSVTFRGNWATTSLTPSAADSTSYAWLWQLEYTSTSFSRDRGFSTVSTNAHTPSYARATSATKTAAPCIFAFPLDSSSASANSRAVSMSSSMPCKTFLSRPSKKLGSAASNRAFHAK